MGINQIKKIISKSLFIITITCTCVSIQAQDTIKNVILMIPDGTSTGLLSMSRYYAQYHDANFTQLSFDPYVCGLVITRSSDEPIGESAPTTSCFVTGQPTQGGFISTYPVKTSYDMYPLDSARAYQPMATVLEAARILKNKATGLVFTCEFPHATPADQCAHTYNRSSYKTIAKQMIHNELDVVIGGGAGLLSERDIQDLKDQNYQVILNSMEEMDNCHSGKLWALYSESGMDYEIDRDATKEPSLAEMTKKALELLSQKEEGFYLMVEGSKVDYAAHSNDAKTTMLDFLAFDDAVQVALDFAKKNANTVVLVIPDHGCGGLNLGGRSSKNVKGKLTLEKIMKPIEDYKISLEKMAKIIKESPANQVDSLVKYYFNVELSKEQVEQIYTAWDWIDSPVSKEERKGTSVRNFLYQFLYEERTCFGAATYSHTGEDVFLACYHPQNDFLHGVVSNIAVNDYLCRQLGISGQLPVLTDEIYARHQDLFSDAKSVTIDSLGNEQYRLTVKYKKHVLVADSYENHVTVNTIDVPLSSVVVYMKANNTFYLPRKLKFLLQ